MTSSLSSPTTSRHVYGYARGVPGTDDLEAMQDRLAAAGCEKVFVDHLGSRNVPTPALVEMLELLEAGDRVLVCSLGHLGRSMSELVRLVLDLDDRRVTFADLPATLDTATAPGQHDLVVLRVLRSTERDLNTELTKAGLSAARVRGKRPGRPRMATDEQLARARQLVAAGSTVTAAAAAVGLPRYALLRYVKVSTIRPAPEV